MLIKGKEADLLAKAEAEEKSYNWAKAAVIHEQLTKHFLDKHLINRAADSQKKLGHALEQASHTVDTSGEHLAFFNKAIRAYKEAVELYKQCENKPEELECEGLMFFHSAQLESSVKEVKKLLDKSYELFIKTRELYSKENDQESILRNISYAGLSQYRNLYCCDDYDEYYQVNQKSIDLADEAWKLSKNIDNHQFLAETLDNMLNSILLGKTLRTSIRKDKSMQKAYKDMFSRYKESLGIVKDSKDFTVLGKIYYGAGVFFFSNRFLFYFR